MKGASSDPPTGRVFNIQEYAVHDGPGIRTVVFLKGCPLRCRWCCNPEGQRRAVDLAHSRTLCRKCHVCKAACPHSAVTIENDDTPAFRRSVCLHCLERTCERECPNKAIRSFGRDWTAAELFDAVSSNALYYRNSGGGVTFSGGEPLAQPAFVQAVMDRCEEGGISAGVETCGAFDWSAWKRRINSFEFIFWDLKNLDGPSHRRATGRDNRSILENLKRTAERMAPAITLSITIVPGFNDSPAFAREAAALCRSLGIPTVRLLPYHDLGRSKYEDLGRRFPMEAIAGPGPSHLHQFQQAFQSKDIDCRMD